MKEDKAKPNVLSLPFKKTIAGLLFYHAKHLG